jgi:hypothetical protein
LIAHGIRLIAAEYVGLQTRRGLVGHLYAVLEHGHWELKSVFVQLFDFDSKHACTGQCTLFSARGTLSEG